MPLLCLKPFNDPQQWCLLFLKPDPLENLMNAINPLSNTHTHARTPPRNTWITEFHSETPVVHDKVRAPHHITKTLLKY